MNLFVLEALMESRAELVRAERLPPYVANLGPKRSRRLRAELRSLGVSFGIPFEGEVPYPPEDEEEWLYMGIVLGDVHVYGRADAPRSSPR